MTMTGSSRTTGHTAPIRLKKDGKVLHTATHTFDREPAAKAWMKKREAQLNGHGSAK